MPSPEHYIMDSAQYLGSQGSLALGGLAHMIDRTADDATAPNSHELEPEYLGRDLCNILATARRELISELPEAVFQDLRQIVEVAGTPEEARLSLAYVREPRHAEKVALLGRHFPRGFTFGALKSLYEEVEGLTDDPDKLVRNFGQYFRSFDIAGAQVAFNQAPKEVQELVDSLQERARLKLTKHGIDPESVIPPMIVPAYG